MKLTQIPSQGMNDSNNAHQILDNARTHEDSASKHRLNQLEPKGPQKKRLEILKEKETALKQQRKAEMFTLEASLAVLPLGASAFKKVGGMSHYLSRIE